MDPQPAGPQPTNNYDFILNPQKPQKKLFGGMGGDTFIAKVAFIVGGAIIIMVVGALLVNLIFGSKTNLETLVSLAKTEQEIGRLSDMGKDAVEQQIKNAAINTDLVVTSHQRSWLTFVEKRGREVKSEELNLGKDSSSDRKLTLAKQTSTFDPTYTTLMRASLTDYAKDLKQAYQGATNKQEKLLLDAQYKDVVLLLKQWPAK